MFANLAIFTQICLDIYGYKLVRYITYVAPN